MSANKLGCTAALDHLGRNCFLQGDYEKASQLFIALIFADDTQHASFGWCAVSLLACEHYDKVDTICQSRLATVSVQESDWLVFWKLVDVFVQLQKRQTQSAKQAFENYLTLASLMPATSSESESAPDRMGSAE